MNPCLIISHNKLFRIILKILINNLNIKKLSKLLTRSKITIMNLIKSLMKLMKKKNNKRNLYKEESVAIG